MRSRQKKGTGHRYGFNLTEEQLLKLTWLCARQRRSQSNMVGVLIEDAYRAEAGTDTAPDDAPGELAA